MNDVVNSSNEFSFNMYRELLDGDQNVFFSPYSITIALGMAYEGARGETAKEIQLVIELPEDNEERRGMVRALQSSLNPDSANYELSTANAYWLKMGEDLNDEYQSTLENDYRAYGQELDFAGDSDGSTDTINDWVEDQTNDRIQDLIDYGLLNALTYMVLTNAIYFKANWRWQFSEEATKERSFECSDGTNKAVQTMNMCDDEFDLNYAENDDVQMLQLPYKDEELSMYMLLPKQNDISSLESKLDRAYLEDLKGDMYGEWVDVYLPKFKFDQKYDLIPPLKNMGMNLPFGAGADFSGMDESGRDDLFISDVIHQSFVEVNEEGTEAAAATAVVMTFGGMDDDEPDPVTFRADHPFIFFIEHQESGQILFMGKVEDPTV
jgi:serpin B